jgi:hypothetical protein
MLRVKRDGFSLTGFSFTGTWHPAPGTRHLAPAFPAHFLKPNGLLNVIS